MNTKGASDFKESSSFSTRLALKQLSRLQGNMLQGGGAENREQPSCNTNVQERITTLWYSYARACYYTTKRILLRDDMETLKSTVLREKARHRRPPTVRWKSRQGKSTGLKADRWLPGLVGWRRRG